MITCAPVTDGNAVANSGHFSRLVDILATGPRDLVAAIECYSDESFNENLLCVAGYAFAKTKSKHLDAAWRIMLARYELPYFRMSQCAHGKGPFSRLSPEQRIAVETHAIGLIKKYATVGAAVAVNPREFVRLVPENEHFSTPYEFCVWQILVTFRRSIEAAGTLGEIAYLFEAGHKHQSKANALMNKIFRQNNLRQKYRYAAHAFVDKEKSRPCQAADLLSWQAFTERKRQLTAQRAPRKDFVSLVDLRHHVLFATTENLVQLGIQLQDQIDRGVLK